MNDLTLIIPAKNESESLPIVLRSLSSLNLKIIISLRENDLSTINSIKKNDHIKLFFQSGRGYGNSLEKLLTFVTQNIFVYSMLMFISTQGSS